jgi:DNA-directed RNA polymerase specialized sigma24 family protein
MAKRDGMSYADIAKELGISQNTVRNNISKALDTLRKTVPANLNFILLFF